MATPKAFEAISKKTGKPYFLHGRLAANNVTMLYFFAKEIKAEGALADLPEGYEISENSLTGLPILKRKVAAEA